MSTNVGVSSGGNANDVEEYEDEGGDEGATDMMFKSVHMGMDYRSALIGNEILEKE